MSNKAKTFYVALIMLLSLALVGTAEAARFGGGKSFGGKSSYSAPYKRSTDSATSANSSTQRAAPTAAPAAGGLAGRSGLMGMLGGLAIGGLLGSMLFGGGFHGINPLDILLFAVVAFVAYKLLSGRRSQPQAVSGDQAFVRDEPLPGASTQHRQIHNAGFDTDILSHRTGAPAFQVAPTIPADFDLKGFLAGAEAAYRMLQTAWDQGDLADVRGLTTDKVFAEIQEQFRSRQGDNRTDLLKVATELLEVRERDSHREASVMFDVLLRENDDERPKQVREVWHFIRSHSSRQPTWFLDGIQQLED